MRILPPFLGSIALLFLAANAPEPSALVRGQEIAEEADRRESGFVDSVASVEMVLQDASGKEARRFLTIKTREGADKASGQKSLVLFHKPLDVKGTALLTHAEITQADQQWLYLPAIKRVKRVPSTNRAGPFMASEFSYEDMLPPEIERYQHHYQATVRCGAQSCFKLERVPLDPESGYRKQIAYLDTEHYRLQRVDYFDTKDTHFKTLFFQDYRQYEGRFWRALQMTMVNHRSGKTTYLLWDTFAFGNGFSDADFSQVALQN
ncbi:MAG: outer membrane lipoprotein-sorting protein [Pseudomonadota bacterium]